MAFLFSMHLLDATQFQVFLSTSKQHFLIVGLQVKTRNLTKTFQELSDTPVEVNENHLNVLENFIKNVYYPKSWTHRSLDDLRMENFLALANMNLRLLPPSKKGLYKHAQRGCLQGGWVNRECRDNVLAQDPRHWGWKKTNHVFLPEWQDSIDIEVDINIITSTSTCTTALCRNCKCAKKDISCLPFCSCRRKCARSKDKQGGNAAYGDTNAV